MSDLNEGWQKAPKLVLLHKKLINQIFLVGPIQFLKHHDFNVLIKKCLILTMNPSADSICQKKHNFALDLGIFSLSDVTTSGF